MAIEGDRVMLRELRESDLPVLTDLRNDLDTQAWGRTLPPHYTVEMIRRRYWEQDFSFRPTSAVMIVEDGSTGECAGFVAYSDVKDRHEATIGVVVGKPFWGTGVAHEAVDLLLWLLFERMGLRVVRLWTEASNERAVRAAERLGFREGVRMRRGAFRTAEYADSLLMDVLREEWYELHPQYDDRLGNPWA